MRLLGLVGLVRRVGLVGLVGRGSMSLSERRLGAGYVGAIVRVRAARAIVRVQAAQAIVGVRAARAIVGLVGLVRLVERGECEPKLAYLFLK